jgi:aquaporin Z
MKNLLTEFAGTFFLVLTISLAVAGGTVMPAIPIGLALMVCVYMGGHISGAHYNPAVTLAVYLRGKLPARDVGPYMIAQVVGGLAAAGVGYYISGQAIGIAPPATVNVRGTEVAVPITVVGALLVEFLFTFLLALVVLHAATNPKTAGNSYYGAAIGLTVAAAAASGGAFSGGAFNPAVGIGLVVTKAVFGGGSLIPVWLYLVGPLLGGAAAAEFFKAQLSEDAPEKP